MQDCAISPDGRRLVAISPDKQIIVYNFITREEEYSILLKVKMTCISISQDSQYMLLNMADNEVQLIDIETAEIVRRFFGQKQGEFVIRSAFGGGDENLIISGSEGNTSRPLIPPSLLLTHVSRFSRLHLAQRKRHPNREPRRPRRLRQRRRLEPNRSLHVRLRRRRQESPHVRPSPPHPNSATTGF